MTELLHSTSASPGTVAIDWPIHRRLMMVVIGYLPFLMAALVIGSVLVAGRRWGMIAGLGCGAVMVYVLPPLAYRIESLLFAPQSGRHPVASQAFLRWWLSAQWQVSFNRLPMLEEVLRIVPGLYSIWLRLWGAKIGSLVYWSPGVAVLDRPFLRVGNRVVFGAGVRLNPHVIVPGKKNEAQLWLAPVTLGDDALIGGYSLITAGCTISAGVSVPAGKYVRPFSTWQDNQPAQSRYEGDSN
jgi:acetyltransferase-like isoleucine patch superfamily enzyme